jgi:hypothetical protein
MLFSVLLLLPSIAGFTDSTQVKGAFVYPSQGVVWQAEMSEWVAQSVSKDTHKRCLAAKDYSGCIQSNSGQSPGVSGPTKNSTSILGREKCFDSGVCIAKSGQDQLGLPKVVGWMYSYSPAHNTVSYWSPEDKRVPHKGQPARYIAENNVRHYYQQPVAATPGYYREISPAKTTCTPTYSGTNWVNGGSSGHRIYKKNISGQTCTTSSATKVWVAGTPGTAGGPRKYSYVDVIDCQDLTHATYHQGRLRGNWSKYVGDEAKSIRKRCSNRANFKVNTMKL